MMDRWCDAPQADMSFRQQLDPLNGEFTKEDTPNYSPAALVMLDYTWRLAGVAKRKTIRLNGMCGRVTLPRNRRFFGCEPMRAEPRK